MSSLAFSLFAYIHLLVILRQRPMMQTKTKKKQRKKEKKKERKKVLLSSPKGQAGITHAIISCETLIDAFVGGKRSREYFLLQSPVEWHGGDPTPALCQKSQETHVRLQSYCGEIQHVPPVLQEPF